MIGFSTPCPPGSPTSDRPRGLTLALMAGVVLLLGGCGELLFHPTAPAPAVLELAVVVQAPSPVTGGAAPLVAPSSLSRAEEGPVDLPAAMAGAAFDAADAVQVRVRRGGALVLDVVETMEAEGSDRRVRLQVPATPEPEVVQVEVELLFEGAPLFRGANETVVLAAGQTSGAEVLLAPVPDRVALEAGPVVLTALEDERSVDGGVVFATGDAFPGAVLAWTTDNAAAVTVDQAGRVRARAPGQARVTATFEGRSGSVVVRVEQTVATVEVTPASALLGVDEDLVLEARLRDANGFEIGTAGRAVAWTSSDPQRATVTAAGVPGVGPEGEAFFRTTARGVSEGRVTVTASAEGVSGTAELDVAPLLDGTLLGQVVVEGTSIPLAGVQLLAQAQPPAPSGSGITLVTGSDGGFSGEVRPGNYTLTLSAPGFQAQVVSGVVVESEAITDLGILPLRPDVAQVVVVPSSLLLGPGMEGQLAVDLFDAGGRPIDVSGRSVSWSSADSLIAVVDGAGRVLGVAPGVTTVTATSEGVTGTASITVSEADLPVAFPDPALESVVRSALDRLEGDLLRSDLLELTVLDASEAGVSDLTGLEMAENLVVLNLNLNAVSELSPILELRELIGLGLYGNPLSDPTQLVSLSGLQELNLGETGASSLSFLSDLPNLVALNVDGNGVSDLGPLAGLSGLYLLYAASNQVADLSPLSGLTELEFLDVADNQIEDLGPLADLVRLEELYLELNTVEDLGPLQNLTQLQIFYATENRIEDLAPLGGLAGLRFLELSANQITGLGPLQNLATLQVLGLEANQISDLAPLVANGGLGSGDEILLRDNPLSLQALCQQIPDLISRGATVLSDGFCPGFGEVGARNMRESASPPAGARRWRTGTLLGSPPRGF